MNQLEKHKKMGKNGVKSNLNFAFLNNKQKQNRHRKQEYNLSHLKEKKVDYKNIAKEEEK